MGWAFAKTDGLVSYGKRIMNHDMKAFQFPEDRTCVIPPAITAHKGPVRNLRGEFGINEKEKIIGVIGRLKPDRGYDIILKGFKELRDRMNGVKLIIVGRSSQIEKSIIGPINELGIQDDVILAGYRIDDYFSMISTFDLFIMMRAGSDGSARALREVMAMGKAAIVADSGMLPELVRDGVSGYVVKADPHELADRMERVLKDEGQRNTFEKNAQKIAAEEWNYSAQARRLKEFYERLLALGKRPPPERSLRG
jgi:glycosyltransferase involved in cell wall biosynthesis